MTELGIGCQDSVKCREHFGYYFQNVRVGQPIHILLYPFTQRAPIGPLHEEDELVVRVDILTLVIDVVHIGHADEIPALDKLEGQDHTTPRHLAHRLLNVVLHLRGLLFPTTLRRLVKGGNLDGNLTRKEISPPIRGINHTLATRPNFTHPREVAEGRAREWLVRELGREGNPCTVRLEEVKPGHRGRWGVTTTRLNEVARGLSLGRDGTGDAARGLASRGAAVVHHLPTSGPRTKLESTRVSHPILH